MTTNQPTNDQRRHDTAYLNKRLFYQRKARRLTIPARCAGSNNTVPLYVQMKLPYSLAAVTWSQFRVYGLRHVAWRVNVDLRGADRLTLDNRLVEWTRRQPTNQKIVVSSANSMSLRPQQRSLHVGANRLNVNDLCILPSPSDRQSVGRLCLLTC